MNLKQLEVFVAVAETGSFSRGADASFITQSTVSQHVSALESELGLRLFDRTGKGAFLTEGGKLLLHHARLVLGTVRETDRAVRRFHGMEEAELRIGGSTIPGNYMIPSLLPLLRERHPGLVITLLLGDSREIMDRLLREEIEVGVIGTPFERQGVALEPVGRDEIVLVAGKGHSWQEKGAVSLAELESEPLIVREEGSGTGRTVLEALTRAGLPAERLRPVACLGSCEAAKGAVMAGMGVSFLSRLSVRQELERQELLEIPVAGVEITRHFHLASRSGRELSPAATAFMAAMREMYAVGDINWEARWKRS